LCSRWKRDRCGLCTCRHGSTRRYFKLLTP
jgi:hypothetical protein